MADSIGTKAEGLLDEAIGRTKDATGGLTDDLGKQLGGKAQKISGKTKQDFSDLYDENESKFEAITSFIQDRPVVALLIAAVVGLIIGRLILGRR